MKNTISPLEQTPWIKFGITWGDYKRLFSVKCVSQEEADFKKDGKYYKITGAVEDLKMKKEE